MEKIIFCSAHQPAFLPWAGLLQKMLFSEKFIVMDLANFRKRSFMHRNKIEINKKENFVGINISKNQDTLPCNKIEIYGDEIKINLEYIFKKIYFEYKKYNNFTEIEDFFNYLIKSNPKNFLDLIDKQNKYLLKKFKSNSKIYKETDIYLNFYKALN